MIYKVNIWWSYNKVLCKFQAPSFEYLKLQVPSSTSCQPRRYSAHQLHKSPASYPLRSTAPQLASLADHKLLSFTSQTSKFTAQPSTFSISWPPSFKACQLQSSQNSEAFIVQNPLYKAFQLASSTDLILLLDSSKLVCGFSPIPPRVTDQGQPHVCPQCCLNCPLPAPSPLLLPLLHFFTVPAIFQLKSVKIRKTSVQP